VSRVHGARRRGVDGSGCETVAMAVRRIIPYHETRDFDATPAFYTRVLKLEEGSFGGGYIGFGSGQAQVVFAPPGVEPWGVRRFFVRDPNGGVISVLAHD
jgi:hypothetical protein